MPQRRLALISLSLLLVLSMMAPVASVAAQDDGPIIIGAPLNLTGWMAAYDTPPLEGAKLAVKEINANGGVMGRQLEIIERDGKTDPATVGNAAREVIEAGAQVLITPCDFDYGAPAGQAAQEAGIVGISLCASSPLYGAATLGDKQFTLSMWNQTMAAAAAEFAFNDKGWKTAATLVDQGTEYTKSLGEYFVEAFEHLGGTIVNEDTYQINDMQATAQAQRLKELDPQPDVIFVSSQMPDYSAIIRDLRSAGVTAPIMGGDSMDTADFYKALGTDLGKDIFISTHSFIGPEAGPAMEKFIADFNAEYGRNPEVAFNAMGWDAIQVLAKGIEKAGTTEGAALAKALEGTEFDLLSGKLVWSDAASGHFPDKEAFIIEIKDGAPTFVKRTKPSWTPPTD
ncbi:MAG: ABC transporter substrate-binding protein [Thermomicrobiales bacterium]